LETSNHSTIGSAALEIYVEGRDNPRRHIGAVEFVESLKQSPRRVIDQMYFDACWDSPAELAYPFHLPVYEIELART
jgi:hypothetical protein